MQSIMSGFSRTSRLFTKNSRSSTFSKRSQPPSAANSKNKKKALLEKATGGSGVGASKVTSTPHEPFGLSKQQITRLKKSIEASHQNFFEEWTKTFLTSTSPQEIEARKQLRREFARVGRNLSMKHIGLLGTAKNMLTGNALYARMEEDGVREHADELIIANIIWVWESVAKKALYGFPAIYSHTLDEIFNQNLFCNDDKNYLVESGAISPQLAQALVQQSKALEGDNVATNVKVRMEASPPTVVGYSSRLQSLLLEDYPLPKSLSLLHIPGGNVRLSSLPLEYENTISFCVHIMVHTHETYTFMQQHGGKSKSAKLNTPRILTLNGHCGVKTDLPSESDMQALKHEFELAAIEDREYDLFAHDSTRYNKVYPDGNPLNETFGVKWQLVDIDFLVARTRGWVEIDKDGFQIKDRFCYQPPLGYLDYDKEEAAESMKTRMDQGTRMMRGTVFLLFVMYEPMLLILLGFLVFGEGVLHESGMEWLVFLPFGEEQAELVKEWLQRK